MSGVTEPDGDKTKTIDLTDKPSAVLGKNQRASMAPVHPHSLTWAKVVKPFAFYIFSLVTLVIVAPFFFAAWTPQVDQGPILEWAKVVFPPVVGFASAVVGYFFGTRSVQNNDSEDTPEE